MLENIIGSSTVDYSTMMGERILPFKFELDLESSVLYPEPGQCQKFCYDIQGVGRDSLQYEDLNYFVMGICKDIVPSEINEVTVSVDGNPETVIWGENVEIMEVDNPDVHTGCGGLKIAFPLNKSVGRMKVCISLKTPYTVGQVNVGVFGGSTAATGMTICGPAYGGSIPCHSMIYQEEKVSVPVKVNPYASTGKPKTTCCGEPVITPGNKCTDNCGACSFTITQTLRIEIPVKFGATIEIGKACVQCGKASEKECDCEKRTEEINGTVERNENEVRDRRFFGR